MNKEREISVAELFWRILLGWRSIIVAAIVFTLLLSGYSFLQYSKAQKSYDEQLKAYNEAMEQAAVTKDEDTSSEGIAKYVLDSSKAQSLGIKPEEIGIVNVALEYKSLLKEREKYLASSLYMNLDPYKEKTYSTIIRINPEIGDISAVQSFVSLVNSCSFAEKFSGAFDDVEPRYIEELISADLSGFRGGRLTGSDNRVSVVLDESACQNVTVSIAIPDSVSEESVVLCGKRSIEEIVRELSGIYGRVDFEIISEEVVEIVDDVLVKAKYNQANELSTIRNNFQTNYDKLSAEGKAYIDPLFVEASDESAVVPVEPAKPSFSKKYVLLGFVLGIFLAIVFIVCKVIFASKLVSRSELETMFGLRLLGLVNSGKKYSGIDKWLVSMQNRTEKQMDGDQRLEILCSNLELTCRKEEIDRIVLTGSNVELLEKETVDAICSKLEKAGINVTVCSSICYDMAALRETAEIGTAVLVEKVGDSAYREIEKEINELRNNDVRLLGCICAARM